MRLESRFWYSLFLLLPLGLLDCQQNRGASDGLGNQNAMGESTSSTSSSGGAGVGGTGAGTATGGSPNEGGNGGTGSTECPPWDDGNSCNLDGCLDGTQFHTLLADGTACEDGNACLKNKVCQGGVCVAQEVACALWETCKAEMCSTECGGSTFAPPKVINIGILSGVMALADVNGDGKLDMLTISNNFEGSGSRAHVFFNTGNDTFVHIESYPFIHTTGDVKLGDLNGDNTPDLVVVHYHGGVTVLFNQGNGTFAQPVHYDTGQFTWMGVVADLNGDDMADIIVPSNSGPEPYLTVLQNMGSGSFAKKQYPISWGVHEIRVADMNADNRPDVVILNGNEGNLEIMFQDASGNFDPDTVKYPLYPMWSAYEASIADFNGDGSPDVAIAHGGETNGTDSGFMSVWLNDGSGNLTKYTDAPIGPITTDMEAVDLDGDGDQDFLIQEHWRGELWIFLNQGNAQFKVDGKSKLPSGTIAVGDLNNDGKPDVAGYGGDGNQLIYYNGCMP